jgi:hypothetical protein
VISVKQNQKEREMYEKILRENVSDIKLKRWPFSYHCGLWNKHKPDANNREYTICINKTQGVESGKLTLIHELIHIRDDLEGLADQPNHNVESRAIRFYEKNKRFVDYLWEQYIPKSSPL